MNPFLTYADYCDKIGFSHFFFEEKICYKITVEGAHFFSYSSSTVPCSTVLLNFILCSSMRSSRSLLKQLSSLISTPKGKTTFAPRGTLRNPVHAIPSLSRTPFPYLPILATLSLLSFPQSARTSSSHTHFLNLFMGNEMSSGGAPIGREEEEKLSNKHFVLGTPLRPPYPEGFHRIVVATGCYWGAEKGFWRLPGVYSTAVGYAGGETKNPSYREACSGLTGHTEAVHIVWDPSKIGTADILKQFWECHNPTQVNGQVFPSNNICLCYLHCIH